MEDVHFRWSGSKEAVDGKTKSKIMTMILLAVADCPPRSYCALKVRTELLYFNAIEIFLKKGLDKLASPAYNDNNNRTAQTSDGEKYPMRQTFREPPMVGTGRRAAGEWTPEGGPNGDEAK